MCRQRNLKCQESINSTKINFLTRMMRKMLLRSRLIVKSSLKVRKITMQRLLNWLNRVKNSNLKIKKHKQFMKKSQSANKWLFPQQNLNRNSKKNIMWCWSPASSTNKNKRTRKNNPCLNQNTPNTLKFNSMQLPRISTSNLPSSKGRNNTSPHRENRAARSKNGKPGSLNSPSLNILRTSHLSFKSALPPKAVSMSPSTNKKLKQSPLKKLKEKQKKSTLLINNAFHSLKNQETLN